MHEYIPIPLLVNLVVIDAGFEDAAPADEEQHVAEGARQLIDEAPESEQN